MVAWSRGSREKGSCEGVRGCGRRRRVRKEERGGRRVRKEGRGCGRRKDEDVRGGMRMWEGEGRNERGKEFGRRGRVVNKGGCERREEEEGEE